MRLLLALLFTAVSPALAGPYEPAAGLAGSSALPYNDTGITHWASRVVDYQPGSDLIPLWQQSARALGPAGTDVANVVSLGNGGSITLRFDGAVVDGSGDDFVVFANGFADFFIECAYVEVSDDGVNFIRFPGQSATAAPVPAFGFTDPTDVTQLGSKYRVGFGEPYDLADVGLASATHVRLVDIVGDGNQLDASGRSIYDPHVTVQSAGFDLDAVGVLNFRHWQTRSMGALSSALINATAIAHLPEGRLLLGRQGSVFVQHSFASTSLTSSLLNGLTLDPSFIATRNASEALLGAGGSFGLNSGLHLLDPSNPSGGVHFTPLAQMQSFDAVYWRSTSSALEGWIIAGTNFATGPGTFAHNLTFLSSDGSVSGPLTGALSTFSAGVTTDDSGRVYAALYELPFLPAAANSNWVVRFDDAAVDAAVQAIVDGTPAPLALSQGERLFQFDSAASIVVDAWGRLWGTGFDTQQLQVFDPVNGASARFTPDHDPLPGVTDPIYQIDQFRRQGEPHLAFLVKEETGTDSTPILHGTAPLTAFRIDQPALSWRTHFFGAAQLTPENEATLWGDAADPDGDGVRNLAERRLGRSPILAEPSTPITARIANERLELHFELDPSASEVAVEVQVSENLLPGSWTALARFDDSGVTPLAAGVYATVVPSGARILCRVNDTVPSSSHPARFMRLRFLAP